MAEGYTYKSELNQQKGEYTISVVVTPERFADVRERTYTELANDIKISGFRPGKAPRQQIESKLGAKLLSETIRHLLPEIAAEIVETEELNPVTQLDYNLQKTSDAGVEFVFSFAQYPEVKLPDLKKLGVKKPEAEKVTDKEIGEVMQRLLTGGKQAPDKQAEFDMTTVTDAQVAELALDDVKTVDSLKEHIAKRLEGIKAENAQHHLEHEVLHAVIDKSKFTIPERLITEQTQLLMDEYLGRIKELDVDVDEFLKAQGTSQTELEKQKREEAEHRLQHDFILNAVAKEHNLVPTIADIEDQIAGISDTHTREQLDTPQGRRYILSTLMQQRALQKLLDSVVT